jgi:hypothetical protein
MDAKISSKIHKSLSLKGLCIVSLGKLQKNGNVFSFRLWQASRTIRLKLPSAERLLPFSKKLSLNHAEVDLLMQENKQLVCVEVKARKTAIFGEPESFINNKKLRILYKRQIFSKKKTS